MSGGNDSAARPGAAAQTNAAADRDTHRRLPVTVLTGWLGAGKTTLLNRILSTQHGRKLAVIVNEFGEVGVDGALVVGTDEEVVELSNGCLCCTFRGDLIDSLRVLLRRGRGLDGVLIETTGLADPVPVAQSLYVAPDLRERLALDAVVTLVDARHVEQHLETSPEVAAQIAFADVLLLNKLDLAEPAALDALEARLRALNHLAPIHRCARADVPLEAVLDVGAFDLTRTLAASPRFLDADADLHAGGHEQGVSSIGIDEPAELDAERTTMWLRFLASRRGQDLYRMKGVLAIAGQPQRLVFQGVHNLFEALPDRPWRTGEERRCKLVFIGRHLDRDELRRGFEACRV